MHVEPYLFFNGRCDEAIAFYTQALGARATFVMRYRDAPDAPPPGMLPDGFADKVMHANLLVGDGMVMVSDGNQPGGPDFRGFALSLALADEAAVQQAFAALAEGGDITMPLGPTFWSPCFGMLRDRFGVGWMLMVHQAAP